MKIDKSRFVMKRRGREDDYDGDIYYFSDLEEYNINFPFQLYIPDKVNSNPDLVMAIRTPSTSFSETFDEAIELAKRDDYLIKLIAEVSRDELRVAPRLVKKGSSYDVSGTLNMATIHTDLAGDITVMGLGAGSLETASAMLTDLISILKNKN